MKGFLPVLVAICGGVLYHIAQKTIPKQMDPLLAITMAYVIGIVCCVATWALLPSSRSLTESWRAANGSVWLLGVGAALIEIGFLLAYRANWNLSSTSVIAGVAVALVLAPIGIVFFREQLSWQNMTGIGCCLLGLYLLSWK